MFSLPIKITVQDGDKTWELEYDGQRMLSIGRSPECDIIIDADKASRHHAEVIGEAGRFTLIDSGSANGSCLNGVKVRCESLAPGDIIGIGQARITFGEESAVEAAVTETESAATVDTAQPASAYDSAPRAATAPVPVVGLRRRRSPVVPILSVLLPIVFLGGLSLLIWKLLDTPTTTTPAADPLDRAPVASAGSPTGAAGPDIPTPAGNTPSPTGDGGESDVQRLPVPEVAPGVLTAQEDFNGLMEEIRQGQLGWDVIARLDVFVRSNEGTPAAERASRWIPILAGIRVAVEGRQNQAADAVLDRLLGEGHYAEALASTRYLLQSARDEDTRGRWRRRLKDIDSRAASHLHQVERDLGELVRAGKVGEALRALVEQRLKFAGTSAYEELLPRYVTAGLEARRKELSRPRFDSAELARLSDRAATAFEECRFRDLVPIYYRILALNPPAAQRIDALEGLVDAFYLARMFENFLADVAGKPVEVSLSDQYQGRVVRADFRELEHEYDVAGHAIRDTRTWVKVPAVKKLALFGSVKLDRDARLGYALFCWHHGFEEGAQKAVVRLNKRKDSRELAAAILARHRGIPVPESGFVEYRGRLVTPGERDLDIAGRRKAKEEQIARLAELRKMKLARKVSVYIEYALNLRKQKRFEGAHKILTEIAARHDLRDTDGGAEARRLLEDPLLGHDVLVDRGPSANRLDIGIMGDGFPVNDDYQASFAVYANTCKNLLLTEEPYREYQSYLNFFTVLLGSRDTGLSTGADRGSVQKDTALGGKVEWSVITVDGSRVMAFLDRIEGRGSDHVAIVIGNDFADVATGGGGLACLSKAGLTPVGHELGHGIGGLHDEYDSPAGNDPDRKIVKKRGKNVPTRQNPPNLMEGSDRDDVLAHACWQHWIEAGEDAWWNGAPVAVFEGGGYSPFNIWRPQANCKMRSASVNFCVVCMEVMVKAIYRYVRPIDRVEPAEKEVVLEDGREQVFKVWPMKPETHFLEAEWTLLDLGANPRPAHDDPTKVDDERPGELYRRVGRMFDAEGRVVEVAQIRTKDLRGGRYRLRVKISDPTPWVIEDPEGLLDQKHEWIITVE